MSAEATLRQAYQEWRRLAEAEGEAIRSGDWLGVAECQSALGRLQSRIVGCTDEARQQWMGPGSDGAAKEQGLQATVAELIEIERRNSALLNLVRRGAQQQLEQLSEAGRTLRRIQRSYAPPPAPVWTSFS